MSIASVLKQAIKEGYYVVTYGDMHYAFSESEALIIIDALDKQGIDSAAYRLRDGVFRRCRVVDLVELFSEQQKQ